MTAGRMWHAAERERKLKHKVRGSPHEYVPSDAMLTQYCPEPNKSILEARQTQHHAQHAQREPEPRPETEWDKRRSEAQKNLRCIQDACPYWFDSLPTFSCTITGEQLCLMSMPDMEIIVEKCPYSGAKGVAKWNAHLLK